LIGRSHERDAIRVSGSRIRGKVSYASKAEHDFSPPEDFERRLARKARAARRHQGTAKIFLKERIALVERDFGAYGKFRNPAAVTAHPAGPDFETEYAQPADGRRALHRRQNATVLDPPELAEEVAPPRALSERHSDDFESARSVRTVPPPPRASRSTAVGHVDPARALARW
jgi:proteasome accessory factor C